MTAFHQDFEAALDLCRRGRLAEAAPLLTDLLARSSSNDERALVAMNLGGVLVNLGDMERAEAVLRQAEAARPDIPEVHNNLGALLSMKGKTAEAAEAFRRAAALRPDFPEAHYNLGRVVFQLGDRKAAVASYHKAIALKPDYAEAMSNLGGVLVELGQLNEALEILDRGLKLDPTMADGWNNAGQALRGLGRRDDSIAAYSRAIAIKPGSAIYTNNLGVALFELGRLGEAMAQFEQARRIDPAFAPAYGNIAMVLERQGHMEQAIENYERSVSLDPANSVVHSNYLFAISYVRAFPPDQIRQRHEAWYAQHGKPLTPARLNFRNDRSASRRLRIGYVSPDFREHAVACFIAPVMAAHDRREVEVFAYSEAEREDATTEKIKRLSDHWHRTTGETDTSLAAQIQKDKIDIMIDLAGHTGGNRLKVFAMKPAPVQASYLGYFATTGLATMDWWVTDRTLHPDDSTETFSEKLMRLDRCWVCYEADGRAPEPAKTGDINRPVTFGSFNQLQKLSTTALMLWAKVLVAVPDSRLLLKTKTLADELERKRITEAFAANGVAPERLDLRSHSASVSAHLATYGEMDIALDPFPCNGGTTTADALWMGVPVLTLPGPTMIERMSASMLTSIGLDECIARSAEDFVARAINLAADNERLSYLRANLRGMMRKSPLCDGLGLARALEGAYRRMWQDWIRAGQ